MREHMVNNLAVRVGAETLRNDKGALAVAGPV